MSHPGAKGNLTTAAALRGNAASGATAAVSLVPALARSNLFRFIGDAVTDKRRLSASAARRKLRASVVSPPPADGVKVVTCVKLTAFGDADVVVLPTVTCVPANAGGCTTGSNSTK